jgi:hypothetical protein
MSGIAECAELHAPAAARRRRSRRRGLNGMWAGALLSTLVLFGACEGDNLFGGDPAAENGRVEASVNPTTALTGDTIRVRVEAANPVGLRRIGFAALTAAGDTVGGAAVLVPTSGAVRDTVFTFIVPAGVLPSDLTVHGVSVDVRGRRAVSAGTALAIADGSPPRVTIVSPTEFATFPIGDSVRVQVRMEDISGVVSITMSGFAVRRDPLSDTRIVDRFQTRTVTFPQPPATRAPTDTTIARYVLPIASNVTETVHIVVSAKDAAGNIGADTVDINVGGPRVEIRSPLAGSEAVVGQTMSVRIHAVDLAGGVDSVRLYVAGVRQESIGRNRLGSLDSVNVEIPVAAGTQTGELLITATAWNRQLVAGRTAAPLRINVVASAAADTARPRVGVTMVTPSRVEMTDSVRVNVVASDVGSSGLARVGIVAVVIPDTTSLRQDTVFRAIRFDAVQTGTLQRQFAFTLKDLYGDRSAIAFPRRFTVQVHAFAIDGAGNCGASVTTAATVVECTQVPAGGLDFRTAGALTGQSQLLTAVAGYSRVLATGSRIADVVVDAERRQFYMSNIALNRLDVLDLRDSVTFRTVSVGSQPWGMFIANNGNELIVANSGGTNLSIVDLNTRQELSGRRILTPSARVFNLTVSRNEAGIQYSHESYAFSDRPQFVAQDSTGKLLYSTVPTGAAPDGTIRYRDPATGAIRLLFTRDGINGKAEGLAIAHVDSIRVQRNLLGTDRVNLFDHNPVTRAIIQSGYFADIQEAADTLRARGSDITVDPGAFVPNQIGLADTTYLAAAGDRGLVAFGEGARGPFARVMMWDAANERLSGQQAVQDLINNAAERVHGVALDSNGGFGGARGLAGAYFFLNNDPVIGQLRLQGIFSNPGSAGGLALHPQHRYAHESTPRTLSFVPTPDNKVRVVDTFHYCQVGEVTIKDNIVGQVRAVLPWDGENAGLQLTDPNFLIVRLFAVTDTGRALFVDVRRRDLHRGWSHGRMGGASASVCPL